MVVTDLLLESFDDIFDVTYTARMEEELDEIEEGKIEWRVAMAEFYKRFERDLKHAEEHMTDIKRMEKPTDLICEKCGKPMVIKWGRHGSFIACTGYPDCTNTRELTVDLPDVDKADLSEQGDEEYCENCGRAMVLKKGRFGQFYACGGYPDCKTTKPIGGTQKKPDVAARGKVPAVRQEHGAEIRALRRVHRVQQLPDLQIRQAEDHRRQMPGMQGRRDCRAALQARQDLLRLRPLSRLQLRRLEQAGGREMPRVRQPLHAGKVAESRAEAAVPQRGMQVPEAHAAGARHAVTP